VSKLTDADGEQYETQHWVETALDCGYLTIEEVKRLNEILAEIGRMLNGMIAKSSSFCGGTPSLVKEGPVEYFVSEPAH
jgi:hypothetical protein